MSARTEIAAALDAATPATWDVDPFYRVPDNLETGRVRLLVFSTTWRPGTVRGTRGVEVVVWLLIPQIDPETVDDELDAALVVMLDAVDAIVPSTIAWTEAERGTLADGFVGYRVTLTTQHRKA